jgi:hypothetical protein
MYSGGFGSGKTICGCQEAIYKAFQFPGSLGLIGRHRFTDLEQTTQRTFWERMGAIGLDRKPYLKEFNQRTQIVRFGNGSEIVFRGLDDPLKLHGYELSWVYVDEGSEVPDVIYQTVIGRLRRRAPLQLWVTTNPGASGWLRSNFVDRKVEGFDMINAPTTENKYLPREYVENLFAQYPEVWRRRFIYGDWNVFEGQVFTMADPSVHLIAGDWRPSEKHEVYEGWDFGYRNPTAVVWVAYDPSGEEPAVVFAEHLASERLPQWHAARVREIRAHYGVDPERVVCFGDPAGAARQGLTGRSYFQEYADLGIFLSASVKEPSIRALRIGRLFSRRIVTRDGELPALVVTGNCRQTWSQIVGYRYRERRNSLNESPKEEFFKRDDHLVDALGYAVAALPPPDDEPERPRLENLGITQLLRPDDEVDSDRLAHIGGQYLWE